MNTSYSYNLTTILNTKYIMYKITFKNILPYSVKKALHYVIKIDMNL